MLDNLLGADAAPTRALIDDLRVLCDLSPSDLERIGQSVAAAPDEGFDIGALREHIARNLRSLRATPEKLSSVLSVAEFILRQWGKLALDRKRVVDDIRSTGATEEQLEHLKPVLDAIECKIEAFLRTHIERSALKTGTPSISSAVCVCDARAVFRNLKYHKDQGDTQPYFSIDRFVPVVVLELVSELNDKEKTQSFLLTESTLAELCDILSRAQKRLSSVSKAVGVIDHRPEAPNDQTGDVPSK